MDKRNLSSSNGFQFRQFCIKEGHPFMKVSTDSVLLGAWVSHMNPSYILDVGTGNGILALMMAQKFENANIHAIDKEFPQLAQENFKQSKWSHRLEAFHSKISEYRPNQSYDIIISNPPYFRNKSFSPDQARRAFRHAEGAFIAELFDFASHFINEDGSLFLVYPFDSFYYLKDMASDFQFYLHHYKLVRHQAQSPISLVLTEWGKSPLGVPITSEVVLYESNNQRTKSYHSIVEDFYVK